MTWTFLSNHAHVLICVSNDPDARLRDVAARVGITERAVQSIVTDLEACGAITREREGRRNRYEVHHDCQLRHPVEEGCTLDDLLAMMRRVSESASAQDADGVREAGDDGASSALDASS